MFMVYQIEIKTVTRPIPKSGEILVKMEVSGVCFTDVHISRGDHASPNPLPLIMGHEGVGLVVAVGAEEVAVAATAAIAA